MLRVLIVDDHPMVRDGLAVMLESRKCCKVAGKAANLAEAVSFCREHGEPDVVLSDIRMPEGDGFATFEKLKRFFPRIKVLFLAGMPLKDEEERAKASGAKGYLPKSCDLEVLVSAVKRAAGDGGDFICETFAPAPSPLTPREHDVLTYLARGKTRDEIAIILGIGGETVKARIKTLMRKLDVPNAPGAVSRAYELGILRA